MVGNDLKMIYKKLMAPVDAFKYLVVQSGHKIQVLFFIYLNCSQNESLHSKGYLIVKKSFFFIC